MKICRLCEQKPFETRIGNIVVCRTCKEKHITTQHLAQLLHITTETMKTRILKDELDFKYSHKFISGKLTQYIWNKKAVIKYLNSKGMEFKEFVVPKRDVPKLPELDPEIIDAIRYRKAFALFDKNLNVALRA